MIKIYGIHNCDTVQKAIKWLDKNKVQYQFHNFKEQGIDKATIEGWLMHLPLDKVVNARSTTFRELPEADKQSISNKAKAIALMMEHNSIIKRPVWDFGNGKMFLGWDEQAITALIS